MNQTYWLNIRLDSDTAFSRGDGVAGEVDSDVQHDVYGLPYLSGKTIKGLLSASCAEVLDALEQSRVKELNEWKKSAARLFGRPGSKASESGLLHVGDARLPDDLRKVIVQDISAKKITPSEILESLTTLRRQTAMSAETGAALDESLRTIRVILRETTFVSRLDFAPPLDGKTINEQERKRDMALLASCIKSLRRAGAHRNRGLGRITISLFDSDPFSASQDDTETHFTLLRTEMK